MINNNRGAALLLAMLAMLVILTLGMTLLDTGTTDAAIASNLMRRTQAFYAAEAGIEETMAFFKKERANITFPWSLTDVVIGSAEPGGIPVKYSIYVENPSGDDKTITLRSVGRVGNAQYTLNATGSAAKGGGYLNRALTAYGSGTGSISSFDNNSVVNGDFLINHEYTVGNNAELNGIQFTDETAVFPELSAGWYIPSGVNPSPDVTYNRNVTDVNDFKTGADYYKVNGSITLSNNLKLNNVVIESTGTISIGNNVILEGVALVTPDQAITINNNTALNKVVLVGHNIILENNDNSTDVFIYDTGSTRLVNNNDFTGIILTKNTLTLEENATITGSIVCNNIIMENNAALTQGEPATPIIPGELLETAVSLDSFEMAIN